MHWHAYAYDGTKVPDDRDAKNPDQPVRPVELNDWFRKPMKMHHGAFEDADSAYCWLESELRTVYPDAERLPKTLRYLRAHLELGQDAYESGYTRDRAGLYVRCLITCPRTGANPVATECPEPP